MYNITWNPAPVGDFATAVGSGAGQLSEMRDDIQQQTNMLVDYFIGRGATSFQDAQQLFLQGLGELIDTMARHGQVVGNTLGDAMACDATLANLF
jgi:uncharacterized protein YukE